MKVLLVDDSGMIRAIQKKILTDIGLKDFVEATDGLLALKAVAANKFDLILLDWNMPNLSGIETLKKLKSNPASKSIPVIMVTSESEKSQILEAIKIGAANYVVKPFTPAVLKDKLAPYLPPPVLEVPKDNAGDPASDSQTPVAPSENAEKKAS